MKAHSSMRAEKHSYFLQWLEVTRAKKDGKYFNDFKEKDWIGYSEEEKKFTICLNRVRRQCLKTDSKNGINPQGLKIGFIYNPLGLNKLVCLKHYLYLTR